MSEESSFEFPAGAGFDDWNDNEVIIPRVVLSQALTNIKGLEDTPKGKYIEKNSATILGTSVDVVVLRARQHRTLFHEGGKKGRKCWSDDSIVPSPDVQQPVSNQCAGCPNERKDLVISILCLDVKRSLEQGEPVVFWHDAKKTAIRPIRDYIRGVKSQKRGLPEFIVTLNVEKKSSEQGAQWFVPAPADVRTTTGATRDLAKAAYQQHVANTPSRVVTEDIDTEVGEEDIPF